MTEMTNSLVDRLRAMARAEHDDLSIGTEAADRIEELERELQQYARQRNLIRIEPSEFRWTADKDQDDDPRWIGEALRSGKAKIINSGTPHVRMLIHTAEKIVEARPGQWIYREADGKIGVNVR